MQKYDLNCYNIPMTNSKEESYTVKVVKDVESGTVLSQAWFNAAGQEHNENGPAIVAYGDEGSPPRKQTWMVDGQIHRPENEGPAIISYDAESGQVVESYMQNDQLHRTNGPAILVTEMETGRVIHQRFFHNGKPYKPWLEHANP